MRGRLTLLLLLLASPVGAQTLTPAQLTTLKNNIAASADTIPSALNGSCAGLVGTAVNAVPNTSDGNFCLAAVYNQPAAVAFWAWRTSVSKSDYVTGTSPDATTFIWAGNGFITRTAQEQTAWQEMFSVTGTVDPSKANVRQAFTDIFSGTGNAASNRTHMTAMSRRLVTRFERLYTTGTGSTGSPGLLVVEGAVSGQVIEQARNQ